jgi:hypothetical protein
MELTPVSAKEQRRLDKRKTDKTTFSTGETSFESALYDVVSVETNRSVDALMSDLREQERRFIDIQNLVELAKYKQLLQKILKLIMADGFQCSTVPRRRKDRADFLIVKTINEKVDILAKTLASPENKAFALMGTIEEIRGLLLDLTH